MDSVPRKRGRPSKQAKAGAGGQSSPPDFQVANSSSNLKTSGEVSPSADIEMLDSVVPDRVRGRGRPRKYPLGSDEKHSASGFKKGPGQENGVGSDPGKIVFHPSKELKKLKIERGLDKSPSLRRSARYYESGSPPHKLGPIHLQGDVLRYNVIEEAAADNVKGSPFMNAVVKVFCVHTEPNFSLPWQRKRQFSSNSSGFIISGRRVLTNAHSVEHHTQVKLKKRGSDTKFLATVLAIGTECDIAMLTVSDDEFWEGGRLGVRAARQQSLHGFWIRRKLHKVLHAASPLRHFLPLIPGRRSMSSWRYMVIRIGEPCAEYGGQTDPEAHIETCSSLLLRELEHVGDEILLLLIQCAEELPHKSPFYGTLVGLLNLEDEEFGKKLVDHTHANLQLALDSENCNKLRTLLRFLTVLMCSNVILPGALIEVFETLLSSAATTIDEEGGNPAWQARADFYILCILACLPWGGLELFERAAEELERVMVGIEAYLSIRKHVLEPAFLAFDSCEQGDGKGEEGVDMLEDLWGRIQSLADNGWKIDSVPQPHLAFEARLVTGKSHDFGPLTCPGQPDLPSTASDVTIGRQRHEADLKYPHRIRRLRIFPVSKTEEDLQPIDRFVVEEYLLDVLFYLNGCRKECASYMVGLPVPFRYEYIMAETIFSQLLLLPKPPFKIIYYTLVIVDLCKALPAAFPRVVAGAVRALFDRVGDLDMECRTRLVLWLSHHLSNFQFTWPWEEWAHVLGLPNWSPQRVFIKEVLEKEMRLSYWEKIKQSMQNAPTLEELLPPKGGPCFKYSGESQVDNSEAEASLSTELTNMVRGKKTARDVDTWLEEKVLPLHGQKAAIEIVVQTLLNIGSKSFTHLVTVLERYGQVITKLGFDQANQVLVIEEVAKLWQNSAQMTALTIDRMMGYRIISNLAIVSWVFSPGNVEQFHTSDLPWEILRNSINKTYNRISDLRKEVASAEKSAQKAVESSIKAQAELETAESLAEGVDAEEAQIEAANKVKQLKEAADRAKEEKSSAQGSLEAKEALLIRALRENEALFIAVYKNFSNVLMKGFSSEHSEKQGESSTPDHKDPMAVDSEEPSAMDADDDDEERRNQRSVKSNGLHVQEEQWCRCTLGQVRSLTRQYATEVWPHIEKLDAEVFTGDVHPSFLRAVYSGLRRPFFQLEGL